MGGRPRGQGPETGILVPLRRGVQAADVAVRQPGGQPASHTQGQSGPSDSPRKGQVLFSPELSTDPSPQRPPQSLVAWRGEGARAGAAGLAPCTGLGCSLSFPRPACHRARPGDPAARLGELLDLREKGYSKAVNRLGVGTLTPTLHWSLLSRQAGGQAGSLCSSSWPPNAQGPQPPRSPAPSGSTRTRHPRPCLNLVSIFVSCFAKFT